MLTTWVVKKLGKLLASMPEARVYFICRLIGDLLYFIPNSRTRTIRSNLTHAFPNKTPDKINELARENCRRLIEFGTLVLASPYFSDDRCREIFKINQPERQTLKYLANCKEPCLFLAAHCTITECNSFLPLIMCDTALPKIGVIYRPLKNPKLDQWIQRSRERFGFKMLSRKEGLIKAGKLLKDKQWLSLLFDQNAGKVGTLITQFDRVASATELPGLLHQKYNAKVYISHLKRVDFWRSEYVLKEIEKGEKPIETIFRAHQWLENYLSENNDQCADWLWSHKRWKTQDEPHLRFRIEHKKNALEEDAIFRKRKSPPRRTKLWVRLPNWLGDIVMAMPLIREIQNARPDFDITLLAPKSYTPWIEKTFPKLKTVALPPKGLRRFLFYYRARTQFIDVFLILTNSQRGDIEAFLTRANQRFGIEYQKKRPLLTHKWKIPAELDWNRTHQSVLIEKLVQHFGLVKKVSNRPFHIFGLLPEDNKISILFGSDNSPEKRWPIERWRGLIGKLLGLSPKFDIYLFGTDKDIATANQIVNGFPQEHIKNLTGKTNILQFAEHLAESSLVIANDSGGLHLANFSGTPTIGLYGPTNPIRTGPFYNAIKEIISPPHCPDIGGYPIDYINEEQVMKACREILDA